MPFLLPLLLSLPQASPLPSVQEDVLPLSLDDVVRQVQLHSPASSQSRLSALASGAAVDEAGGAFDPVLFAGTTNSFTERPTAGGYFNGDFESQDIRSWNANQGLRKALTSGGSFTASLTEIYTRDNLPEDVFGLNPDSNVSLNLEFTQPLLRGAWELSGTLAQRTAEIAADQALASWREADLGAIQNAVDAYWDLAFALEDVKVKELSLQLAEELREVTQAKFEVGSAAEVEVVQTEADIATRQDALLTAKNSALQAEDALRVLMFSLGQQEEWDLRLLPISEPTSPQKTDLQARAAFQVADLYRSDLKRLRQDVVQKKLDWDVAKKNLLPKFDLVATGSSAGVARQVPDAFDVTRDFLYTGYSLGFNFEVPFGNHQYRGAELRARHTWELAVRMLSDQRHTVEMEVRDALRSVNYLADRIEATSLASKVAKRQLEAEQRRLEEGASTNFQVLQFQRDYEQALTAEKSARMAFAKASTKMFTVQGLDWDGKIPAEK
ncbi:MAG: TolC family protein [Planctomycetota bacterium]|nr:TolC family protein [Planctomycetota bacterium]